MVHQIAGSQVPTLVVRIRLESLQLTVGKFNSGCGTSPRVPDLLQCASLEPSQVGTSSADQCATPRSAAAASRIL